ncbi:restriction endonuclease, partial [Proteus mirabilis]
MWLFDIIKNGTLVDNQSYFVSEGILKNRRLGKSITLRTKSKGQWTYPHN